MGLFIGDSQPSKIFVGDTPISKVFLGDTQVRPSGWRPDPSRTIFYYDFEDSNNRLADTSGNGNDATSAVSMSYQTVGNQTVANVNAYHGYISVDGTIGGSIGSGDFAISFWHYPINPNYNYPMMFGLHEDNSPYYGPNIFYDPNNTNGQGDAVLFRMRGGSGLYQHPSTTTASSLYNSRHHIVMTRISGTVSCYIDSVLETSWSGDTEQFPTSNASGYIVSRGDSGQSFPVGAMGDKFILENVGRTVQDVSNYYNQTKGNYGIS